MSPEQLLAIMGALVTLIGAVGALWKQVHETHRLVNSRMTELLELTRRASRAEGELATSHIQEVPSIHAPHATKDEGQH